MSARTIYPLLKQTALQYAELPALHQPGGGTEQVYTWTDYRSAVEEIAAALRVLGVGKGDIVALVSDVRAEFYLADLGVMTNGSIAAALYTTYPPAELVRTLRAADVRAVFVEDPALVRSLVSDPMFPKGVLVILLTGDDASAMTLAALRSRGRAVLATQPDLLRSIVAEVTPEDPAILYLTSGATGEPKMGLVSHGALVANIAMGPYVFDFSSRDAMLAFLSPAHIMQRLVIELLPIYCGVPVWFAESLFKLPQDFQRVRPTVFVAPPRLWERAHASIRTEVRRGGRILEAVFNAAVRAGEEAFRARREGRKLSLARRLELGIADALFFRRIRARFGGRLRVCASGSAPLGKGLGEFFLAAGLPLIEGFGLTEGGVVIVNPPGQMKPGSIGKPLPGVEIRIADDGELLLRSPTLFSGYYKDPLATSEVLRDGWLHTGDIAEVDSDGYVFITGRKKEIVVLSSGRKIYPSRIEALFRLEPVVSHVVLIGEGKPHLAALLTVNGAVAEMLPGMQKWRGRTTQELVQAPPVVAALREAVQRVNRKLADFEQIRKYNVLNRDFSIDAGELTATLKVRRARALQNFREAVETLYPGGE